MSEAALKTTKDLTVGQSKAREPNVRHSVPTGPYSDILTLQQTVGNRAVTQAIEGSNASGIPPVVQSVLNSGSGQPLDPGTRAYMESRFGEDFSGVRVHTDSKAAESALAVNANAYTVGRDIVFNKMFYSPSPETSDGRRLLAHELVHIIQQGHASNRPSCIVSESGNAAEIEAESLCQGQDKQRLSGFMKPDAIMQRQEGHKSEEKNPPDLKLIPDRSTNTVHVMFGRIGVAELSPPRGKPLEDVTATAEWIDEATKRVRIRIIVPPQWKVYLNTKFSGEVDVATRAHPVIPETKPKERPEILLELTDEQLKTLASRLGTQTIRDLLYLNIRTQLGTLRALSSENLERLEKQRRVLHKAIQEIEESIERMPTIDIDWDRERQQWLSTVNETLSAMESNPSSAANVMARSTVTKEPEQLLQAAKAGEPAWGMAAAVAGITIDRAYYESLRHVEPPAPYGLIVPSIKRPILPSARQISQGERPPTPSRQLPIAPTTPPPKEAESIPITTAQKRAGPPTRLKPGQREVTSLETRRKQAGRAQKPSVPSPKAEAKPKPQVIEQEQPVEMKKAAGAERETPMPSREAAMSRGEPTMASAGGKKLPPVRRFPSAGGPPRQRMAQPASPVNVPAAAHVARMAPVQARTMAGKRAVSPETISTTQRGASATRRTLKRQELRTVEVHRGRVTSPPSYRVNQKLLNKIKEKAESGQTYAVSEVPVREGVVHRATTAAVQKEATGPHVKVSIPEIEAHVNKFKEKGINFKFLTPQHRGHAEVKHINELPRRKQRGIKKENVYPLRRKRRGIGPTEIH